MNFRRFSAGFALIEIMIATILLCGLIYLFLVFTQHSQRQTDSENIGKQLAITMNTLIPAVSSGECKDGMYLDECTGMSDDFKKIMEQNGLDPSKATVTISEN